MAVKDSFYLGFLGHRLLINCVIPSSFDNEFVITYCLERNFLVRRIIN